MYDTKIVVLETVDSLPVSGKKSNSKHRYILWPDEFGGRWCLQHREWEYLKNWLPGDTLRLVHEKRPDQSLGLRATGPTRRV